ncbi:hypothetical protein ABZP36_033312 [Zizania latifolia]
MMARREVAAPAPRSAGGRRSRGQRSIDHDAALPARRSLPALHSRGVSSRPQRRGARPWRLCSFSRKASAAGFLPRPRVPTGDDDGSGNRTNRRLVLCMLRRAATVRDLAKLIMSPCSTDHGKDYGVRDALSNTRRDFA